MKKLILFAAILFSAFSVANAQSNKGTATLTVNLSPVQSISVTGDVVIEYTSAEDYSKGKGSTDVTTLNVVSAGGFAISVQADDLTGGAEDIPASSIAVTAIAGDNGSGSYTPNVTLGKVATGTKAPLITSTEGGVNKQYKVSYKGTGANKYMKNYNAGGTQSYTTTVTYTIAAN